MTAGGTWPRIIGATAVRRNALMDIHKPLLARRIFLGTAQRRKHDHPG
jgi:hypothetical protein